KEKNISLNTSDQEQLNELLDYVEESYSNSLSAFKENSRKIARSNIQTQSNINQFEKDTKFEHFNSLITKQEHNQEISAVYLDVVNQLMQITTTVRIFLAQYWDLFKGSLYILLI